MPKEHIVVPVLHPSSVMHEIQGCPFDSTAIKMKIDRQTAGGNDLSDIEQNNMWMVLLSKPLSCPAIIIITVNSLSILITHNRC